MTITEYNLCVDEHADGLYRFLLKNLKNKQAAQDIVQDSFEKLWKKHSVVKYAKSKSYLFTTAHHTMIDNIRRKRPTDDIDKAVYISDLHSGQYTDIKELLDEAIDKLPEIQRSVILLRDYEGYNYKEIEDVTGLNESQVKVYIYRARRFLMHYIGSLENVL